MLFSLICLVLLSSWLCITIYNRSSPYDDSTLYDSQHHSLKGVFSNSAGTDPYHLLVYCSDGRDYVLAARHEPSTPTRYTIVASDGRVREADSSVPATDSSIALCAALGFPEEDHVYRTWIKSYSTTNRGWSTSV